MPKLTLSDAERIASKDATFAGEFHRDPAKFRQIFSLNADQTKSITRIAVAACLLTLTDALRIASADPAFAQELASDPDQFREAFSLREDQIEHIRMGPVCQIPASRSAPATDQVRPAGTAPYATPYNATPSGGTPNTPAGGNTPYAPAPNRTTPYIGSPSPNAATQPARPGVARPAPRAPYTQ
jgi:hypothetical protein